MGSDGINRQAGTWALGAAGGLAATSGGQTLIGGANLHTLLPAWQVRRAGLIGEGPGRVLVLLDAHAERVVRLGRGSQDVLTDRQRASAEELVPAHIRWR